jgi:hypothetical protein
MTGSVSQIEWAERIKRNVADEFDRVLRAFHSVADAQSGVRRFRTLKVITVVERKRAEVLAREDAGYFIRDWQEISDQVRQMIARDPAYPAVVRNPESDATHVS